VPSVVRMFGQPCCLIQLYPTDSGWHKCQVDDTAPRLCGNPEHLRFALSLWWAGAVCQSGDQADRSHWSSTTRQGADPDVVRRCLEETTNWLRNAPREVHCALGAQPPHRMVSPARKSLRSQGALGDTNEHKM